MHRKHGRVLFRTSVKKRIWGKSDLSTNEKNHSHSEC